MSKILALLRASLVKVEYTKEKGRQTLISALTTSRKESSSL